MVSIKSLCIAFVTIIFLTDNLCDASCLAPHVAEQNKIGVQRRLCGRRLWMRYYMVNHSVPRGRGMRFFKSSKNSFHFHDISILLSFASTFNPNNLCTLTDHCCVGRCSDALLVAVSEALGISPITYKMKTVKDAM